MKLTKVAKIILICVLVMVSIVVCLWFLLAALLPKTYSSAKKECERFLHRNQVAMEEIASDSLDAENNVSGEFRGHYYSSYISEGLVSFDIDAQGMLGGQYWELVYSKDGNFYGQTETYLLSESAGNNIVRAERIENHWCYVWTDYDGTEWSYE